MDPKKFSGKTWSEKIGGIWKFLDHLAESNPEMYNQFVKQALDDGEKEGLGPPEQFFSIRTHKVPKTIPLRDFYINACKWKQVPRPKSSVAPIPMIAGELREELIKGKICYVVDVALNPETIEECILTDEEHEMLIDVLIKYIEAIKKCNLAKGYELIMNEYTGNKDSLLDLMCPDAIKMAAKESTKPLTDTKIFENLKKMNLSDGNDDSKMLTPGKDEEQNPDVKSGDILLPGKVNLDEECFLRESNKVSSGQKNEKSPLKNSSVVEPASNEEETMIKGLKAGTLCEPSYSLKLTSKGDASFLVAEIDLQGVQSMKHCDVNVNEDSLHLLVESKYKLHVNLDRKIDEENSEAVFVRKTNKLIIKMKCL